MKLYRAVFAVTLAGLLAALAVGIGSSLRGTGRLPSLEYDTTAGLNELLAAGDYETAARQARRLASIDSASLSLLNSIVHIARAHGDPASEIFALRRLVVLRPRDPSLRNRLATLLLEKNRWEAEEAIEHSRVALRLDAESAEARINLGIAALASGRPEEAERYFREALDRDPDAERARSGLAQTLARSGS